MSCHICGNEELHQFLSLGPTPLANSYLSSEQLGQPEPYYPLDVYFCPRCGLVQLQEIVPPEVLFKDYAYLTGVSQTMKAHFGQLAERVMERLKPPAGSLIMDIGSNDGTLLQGFQGHAVRTLGVEPATNVAALATARGVETVNDFFSEGTAQHILAEKGQARVILGTNVFAHVADLEGLLRGVALLLEPDGAFIIEVPYLLDMLHRLEFDTIYHEHLRYFAVRPLGTLFRRFGMDIWEVERIGVHGGSLRVYARKSSDASSASVAQLLELEREAGLDALETYLEFAEAVSRVREQLLALLKRLKTEGARIAGYGAPAKGNTLLNYCQIGTELLDYTVDATPFKQGRYTPGMHIPIVAESHFHSSPPDYALLLAWNYEEEILRKEGGYRQSGGKFIVPIPQPRIV